MLKALRIILAIVTMGLSSYCIITQNFEFIPYLMFLLGATLLVTGLIELKKDRKEFGGYMCIIASLFTFFVSIEGFLLN